MNDEIVEEKKNNTNKILIAIIIILLLLLGGLSYYTFFVRDKEADKPNPVVDTTKPIEKDDYALKIDFGYKTTDEIEKSIETIPYTSLINSDFNYEEMIASEMLSSEYLKLDSNYKTNGPVWNWYMKYYNLETTGEPYKDFLKECNFSTDEIEKADENLWKKSLGTAGGYVIIDVNKIDSAIKNTYGTDVELFKSSFIANYFYYDKNINRLIKALPSGSTVRFNLNATSIINKTNKDNKYEITFINAMFEQYPNESNAKLYNATTYTVKDSFNVETSYSINELSNNKELVNNILKENKDNLDIYKITFELENNLYKFENIKKMN